MKGLEGTDKAIKETKAVLRRLQGDEFREALRPAGERFEKRAYDLAPYDEKRKKGTHLRDALFVDTRKHRPKQTDILVGVNRRKAPHGPLQELGTERDPGGHPFLRPAAEQTRDDCGRDVAAAVKKVVEKRR